MKAYYDSPIGILEIETNNDFISAVTLVEKGGNSETSELLNKTISQLEEYFAGKRKQFDLPLRQVGTPFQEKTWNYMLSIPYGETVSYKDEAIAVGSEKAVRAVGSANGKNHIPIIVPCHRVINSDGKLGGYAYGLEIKKQLLDLEQKYK